MSKDKNHALIIKKVRIISSNEPNLPEELLKKLISFNPYDMFGTSAANGIILKPQEYIYMRNNGMPPFRSSYLINGSLDSAVSKELDPYIESRSAHVQPLTNRIIIMIVNSNKKPLEDKKSASEEKLLKVSPDYLIYRNTINEIIKNSSDDDKIKNASVLLPLAGAFAPYLYAANIQRKAEEGYPIGLFDRTMVQHPLPAAILLGSSLASLGKIKPLEMLKKIKFKAANDEDLYKLIDELNI